MEKELELRVEGVDSDCFDLSLELEGNTVYEENGKVMASYENVVNCLGFLLEKYGNNQVSVSLGSFVFGDKKTENNFNSCVLEHNVWADSRVEKKVFYDLSLK